MCFVVMLVQRNLRGFGIDQPELSAVLLKVGGEMNGGRGRSESLSLKLSELA